MKSILVSSVTWRMAWRNLLSQRRLTLLSILGGCVGAALLLAAVIFIQSFDESGNRWLSQHYGQLDWELRPVEGKTFFTTEELPPIIAELDRSNLWYIPTIAVGTSVTKIDGKLQSVRKGARFLVLGLEFSEVGKVEEGNTLWRESLNPDQVILSTAVAIQLNIQAGDTVALMDADEKEQLFQVTRIVREQGISGYRGLSASEGTILMSLSAAHRLAGIPQHAVTSILSGVTRASTNPMNKAPHFPTPSTLFEVVEQKESAMMQVQQMKTGYGIPFVMCSVIAIIAGMLLMIQILLMLADARKATTAILRALGFTRGQTRSIFFIEATLLNLLITGIGLLVGIWLGYGVLFMFAWFHSDLIIAYSSQTIPIKPFISLTGVFLSGIAVFSLLTLCSLIACYRLGKLNIVTAMRGDGQHSSSQSNPRYRLLRIVMISGALLIILIHTIQLVSGHAVAILVNDNHPFFPQSLFVLILWLVSSVAALYLIVQILPFLQKLLKPLLKLFGMEEAAQFLAFRYPVGNYRRTLNVTLLFSCCFMFLTFILIFSWHAYRELSHKSYTLLEYPAYIKYANEAEKEKALAIIKLNPQLDLSDTAPAVMEPYMIRTDVTGVETGAQLNLIAPNDMFLQNRAPKLLSRSSKFASDEEAWLAVRNDPRYVIWDKKYSYAPEDWPKMYVMNKLISRKLIVEEEIKLVFYEKRVVPQPFEFGYKQVGSNNVEIAGFVDTSTGMEFYNVVFVNQKLYDNYKIEGYRWKYLTEQGYIMLKPSTNSIADLRKLEEQFLMLGVKGFSAPTLNQAPEDLGIVQMMWMLIGFMAMSIMIGLAGLVILQFRAIQERAQTIAMLRCIGFGKSLIRQMLLLEGTTIGWIGLLNGLIFGSIGGYFIVNMSEGSRPPTQATLAFHYPWQLILSITCGFLLITLLLNVLPTRQILQLSPGEAIRSANE